MLLLSVVVCIDTETQDLPTQKQQRANADESHSTNAAKRLAVSWPSQDPRHRTCPHTSLLQATWLLVTKQLPVFCRQITTTAKRTTDQDLAWASRLGLDQHYPSATSLNLETDLLPTTPTHTPVAGPPAPLPPPPEPHVPAPRALAPPPPPPAGVRPARPLRASRLRGVACPRGRQRPRRPAGAQPRCSAPRMRQTSAAAPESAQRWAMVSREAS
eukprot:350413-Chlamydomonas_euryale.AAC.14